MAQSRHRHKHAHHPAHSHPSNGGHRQQVKGKAARIMMIFLGVFGIFIAYISAGPDLLWLAVGAVLGVAAGYWAGRSMDRTLGK